MLSSARSCSHIKTNDAVQAVEEHDQEVKRLALITQLEKTQDMETQTIYLNEIVVGNLSQCVQLLSLISSPFVDSSQTLIIQNLRMELEAAKRLAVSKDKSLKILRAHLGKY